MGRTCDRVETAEKCRLTPHCKWDLRDEVCRTKVPKADYGTIALLLVAEVIAIVVLRYVLVLLVGFDLLNFETKEGKMVGGVIAALTLLWVLRMISSGGAHTFGAQVLQGSKETPDLKRLHARVVGK